MKLPLKPRHIINTPKPVVDKLTKHRDNAFNRFPIIFTLLASFGVVATFYGFEGMINKIEWLADNPVITFAAGVLVLIVTGSLYKKL